MVLYMASCPIIEKSEHHGLLWHAHSTYRVFQSSWNQVITFQFPEPSLLPPLRLTIIPPTLVLHVVWMNKNQGQIHVQWSTSSLTSFKNVNIPRCCASKDSPTYRAFCFGDCAWPFTLVSQKVAHAGELPAIAAMAPTLRSRSWAKGMHQEFVIGSRCWWLLLSKERV